MAKGKETTALALLPTAVQKQQVVAAFTVSGTLERARPLIATLWGVEEAELPADVELRAWVADANLIPVQEQLVVADRFALAANRAKLLDLRDEVIEVCKNKVRPGSEKFFTLLGALKIIGDQLNVTEKKVNTFNAGGNIVFSTSEDHGDEIIEGKLVDGGSSASADPD